MFNINFADPNTITKYSVGDIIKNKIVSGYYAIEADINNAGATYHEGPVVVDSNIVSSPHYDFMGEWMRTGYEVLERRGK